MPDVSPTKWHRAHTTWFFETFVLGPHLEGYRPFDEQFSYLFNSYYEAVGDRHPRVQRGLVSRPSADEVARYRTHVDAALDDLDRHGTTPEVAALIELGLHHEQQHQELLCMDITHVLSMHPFSPAYRPGPTRPAVAPAADDQPAAVWQPHPGGVAEIGHDGNGFAFDNEGPRHEVLLRLCGEVGLDGDTAQAILNSDRYAAEVREAEAFWQQAGIRSVPAFIINDKHLISGGQPPEVFEQALRQIAAQG
jgi:hypothetical protein